MADLMESTRVATVGGSAMDRVRHGIAECRRTIETEAAQVWSVPRRVARFAFLAPAVGAVLVAATLAHRPLYRWVTAEDSVLEWAQVVGFAGAAVGAGLLAVRMARMRWHPAAVLFALACAACVFIAGEEISWGQRLFDVETPEALREINNQEEITVHNIGALRATFNASYLVVGAIGAFLPWIVRRRRAAGRQPGPLLTLITPPLFLTSSFLFVAGYRLVRFTVLRSPRFVWVKYGEAAELFLALALAAFAWSLIRRLRGSSTAL